MTQTQDPAVVLGIGNTSLSTGSVLAQGSADLVLLQDLRQKPGPCRNAAGDCIQQIWCEEPGGH